jgi:hypothetical protein
MSGWEESVQSLCDNSDASRASGPPASQGGALRGLLPVVAGSAFVALSILFGFGVWSVVTFGAVEDGLAFLSGQSLYVRQPVINIGEVPAGQRITIEIPVQNLTAEPLTVLGARTDCSCAVASGLPLTIAPRSHAALQVHLTPSPREAGEELERHIELYSDHSSESLWVLLQGTVAEPVAALSP